MASLDLLRMLREGLLAEVRAATAAGEGRERCVVTRDGLRINDGGRRATGAGRSHPVQSPAVGDPLLPGPVPGHRRRSSGSCADWPLADPHRPTSDEQVAQLQQEIAALREYLQSVIEEQESTNEELKSANEEILSANEELQSTNEELQTAKEEAQSANEELATVNEELRAPQRRAGRRQQRPGEPAERMSTFRSSWSAATCGSAGSLPWPKNLQSDPVGCRPADQRHQAEPGGRRPGRSDHTA